MVVKSMKVNYGICAGKSDQYIIKFITHKSQFFFFIYAIKKRITFLHVGSHFENKPRTTFLYLITYIT